MRPNLARLTEYAMEEIGKGAIKEAIAEDLQTVSNPERFGDLQSMAGGLKAKVTALEQQVEANIDDVKKESKNYYQKVSGQVDDLQERVEQLEEVQEQVDLLDTRTQTQNKTIQNLLDDVDIIHELLDDWERTVQNEFDTVIGDFDELVNKVEELTSRVDEREDVDEELNARVKRIEEFLSEEFDGGIRTAEFTPQE